MFSDISISNSHITTKIIRDASNGSFKSSIYVCNINGRAIVIKEYNPSYREEFFSEVENCVAIQNANFEGMVELEDFDPERLLAQFPYIEGEDLESYIREKDVTPRLLGFLKDAIKLEILAMRKIDQDQINRNLVYHQDTEGDPFFYVRLMLDKSVFGSQRKEKIYDLLKKADHERFLFRGDPEATNYLVNGAKIYSHDFAYFRDAQPTYPIAYIISHLNKPQKRLPDENVSSIKKTLFDFCRNKPDLFVKDPTQLQTTLRLNLVEIYSMLLNAYINKSETYDPNGDMAKWASKRIDLATDTTLEPQTWL